MDNVLQIDLAAKVGCRLATEIMTNIAYYCTVLVLTLCFSECGSTPEKVQKIVTVMGEGMRYPSENLHRSSNR